MHLTVSSAANSRLNASLPVVKSDPSVAFVPEDFIFKSRRGRILNNYMKKVDINLLIHEDPLYI